MFRDEAIKAIHNRIVTMPLKKSKKPLIHGPSWNYLKDELVTQTHIEALDWENAEMIGAICGKNSKNLVCFDVDVKNDPGKTIATEYKNAINTINPRLLPKLVIETSMNGGFHFLVRCQQPYEHLNLAHSAEGLVILETRAHGNYFAMAPSPGYKWVQGDITKIPEITDHEYNQLVQAAEKCDRMPKKEIKAPKPRMVRDGLPGDDYDTKTSESDFLAQIVSDGWEIMREQNGKYFIRRPGKEEGEHSATFNYEGLPGKLYVFSDSVKKLGLENGGIYGPFAYMACTKFDGDFSACAADLAAQGYGERKPEIKKETGVSASLLSELVPVHEEYAKKSKGVKTGYQFFDQITGGIRDELLVLLAAPGAYKTTMLINLLDGMSQTADGLVIFFSMEMGLNSSMSRLFQMMGGLESSGYYKGIKENSLQWRQAKKVVEDNKRFSLCTESALSVEQIKEIVLNTEKKYNQKVRAIGIDYVDFMIAEERSWFDKIREIMNGVKNKICNTLEIPAIVLCQTKRDSNEYDIGLRDAKGGTSIESAADFVAGLWLDKDKTPNCKWLKHRRIWNGKFAYCGGQIDLGSNAFVINEVSCISTFTQGVETKEPNKTKTAW